MASTKVKITKAHLEVYIQKFLAQGDYASAARILWPWYQQNETSEKIWRCLAKHEKLCIIGHAAASKTFTSSIYFLCDWLAHTDTTALILTSATMPSMNVRIWGDFKILWTKSRIDLNQIAQIVDSKHVIRKGINDVKEAVHAVAAESDNSQSKIQGLHCARNRLIIDEADNPYSNSIWKAIDNLSASGDFKAVALANPDDKNSEFGFHCEPRDGWDSINPEVDFEWDSKKGWHVLRLDGLQSPNILAGHDKFPYLLSNKRVREAQENGDTNTPGWWMYIRAWYAPDSLISTIFSSGILDKCNKAHIWYTTKTPIAALDPSFEGGDNCELGLGFMGREAHNPTRTVMEINEYITIKRKDMTKTLAYDYGDQIVSILKDRGVKAKDFAIDATGTQGPFADVIEEKCKEEGLGQGIYRVLFGGEASNQKVTAEDKRVANEMYRNQVTELWYVAREWCRLGLVYIKDCPRDLKIQLEARRYTLKGKHAKTGRELIQAEPKKEMKARGLGSPDKGDMLSIMIALVRKNALGFIPSSFGKDSTPSTRKVFTRNETIFKMDYGVPDRE